MSRPFTEIPGFVSGLMQGARDVLFDTASRIKERLSEEGKPITYPVQWDSERQRQAFFASDGFGKGIPYQRTQRTRLSWQVERTEIGAALHGDHPAGAVFGIPSGWQSRIHRGRWPYLLDVLFEELSRIPSQLSNRFSVRGE